MPKRSPECSRAFDRVVIAGTIPGICYAEGITDYLKHQHIRIFDYTKWADPLRHRVRDNAKRLAEENQVQMIHLSQGKIRKERLVAKIIEGRGDHPGLVAILSAMEACSTFRPWHDKNRGRTFLRHEQGKCLHYYFYFILEDLGLCYLRVPTWAPFRLQFYFNGHHWLAGRLRKAGVAFELRDNAFVRIADFAKAQRLADGFNVRTLHRRLDQLARRCCPVIADFPHDYHWSLMQVEYATDVTFKRQSDLSPPCTRKSSARPFTRSSPRTSPPFWGANSIPTTSTS